MESLRIDILNPKARKLLDGLADLKLIHISDVPTSKEEFFRSLTEMRTENAPSLDEIQKEVKTVRKQVSKRRENHS